MSRAPLEVGLLKQLREHTRLFLKLDFTYLVAAGAIITALKFGRGELMELGSQWSAIGYAFMLLAVVDTLIHSIVFNDWFIASTGTGKRRSPKLIKVLLESQPFFHLIFVTFVITGVLAYSSGYQQALSGIYGKVLLQEEVESYMSEKGSPPKSLDDLKVERIQLALKNLDGEKVKIEATGPKNYKITYAGKDQLFGTADDDITTQDLKLRPIWNEMVSDRRNSDFKK